MLSLHTRRLPGMGSPFLSSSIFEPFFEDEFDLLLQPSSSSSSKRHKLSHPHHHHHPGQYQHPLSLFSAATTAVAHSLFDNSSLIDGRTSTPNKMHLDVIEQEDKYQVKVDLPGMKKEDIKVSINDKTNVLTLSATKSDEVNQDTDAYKRRERYFGSVSRSIRLPESSNLEAIQCGYQDGVLSLQVPKLLSVENTTSDQLEPRPDPHVKSIRVD